MKRLNIGLLAILLSFMGSATAHAFGSALPKGGESSGISLPAGFPTSAPTPLPSNAPACVQQPAVDSMMNQFNSINQNNQNQLIQCIQNAKSQSDITACSNNAMVQFQQSVKDLQDAANSALSTCQSQHN